MNFAKPISCDACENTFQTVSIYSNATWSEFSDHVVKSSFLHFARLEGVAGVPVSSLFSACQWPLFGLVVHGLCPMDWTVRRPPEELKYLLFDWISKGMNEDLLLIWQFLLGHWPVLVTFFLWHVQGKRSSSACGSTLFMPSRIWGSLTCRLAYSCVSNNSKVFLKYILTLQVTYL